MAVYTLPELPYDYSALEPHISGKIMELHHDKHHATYVAGANTARSRSSPRPGPQCQPRSAALALVASGS